MVNGGEQERAGALVGKREKQPSQTTQAYGKPVAEYDVHKAKGQAAGRNHAPSTAKKRLVPLKEEGAIQEFLGTYRKQRIQQHNQRPENGYSSIISAQKRGCRLTSEKRNSGAKMRTAKPRRISRMASRRSTATSCGQVPRP